MKKTHLILAGLFTSLMACTTQQNVSNRSLTQNMGQNDNSVENILKSRHFTLNVNNMYPMRTSGKYVGGEFFLQVKGDTLNSYLPYFGSAFRSSYTQGNALDFKTKMETYRVVRRKKDYTSIYITVRTSEDFFKYTLSVFDNGHFRMDIQPLNRDFISYDGELQQ